MLPITNNLFTREGKKMRTKWSERMRGRTYVVAIAISLAVAVAWAAPAVATNIVTFDPTGTAGPGGDITIDRLDQAPGNAIALRASAQSTVGTNFRILYQANLGTAQLANINV